MSFPVRLLSLFALVGSLTAEDALKQDTLRQEIAAAAAIPNSVDRLAAFDQIAARHKLAPESNKQVTTPTPGKWRVSTDISPVDDSQTVFGVLECDEPTRIGYNRTVVPALAIRFKEGKLEAYIIYGVFLGSDLIEATIRFGKDAPQTQRFSISSDHKAAFVRGDVSAFLQKLSASETLLVRLTPYGENPITVSFSTEGVQKVLDAVAEARKNSKPVKGKKRTE